VGVNSWVAHRDTTVYGADADEYRPERWLESDADRIKAMEHNFMPFGYGARTCIGKNISLLEMNKLIPVLVNGFNFEFLKKDGSVDTRRSLVGRDRWFVKPELLHARVFKRV
jgi:cytochrome P450